MTTEVPNKSPGDILRDAREEKGLTLEDAAAMTRIQQSMLAHLEHNEFDEYTAEVFARGHLRSYARELQVDVDEVMDAYEAHVGPRGSRRQIPTLDASEAQAETTPDYSSEEVASASAARSAQPWTAEDGSEDSTLAEWGNGLSKLTRKVRTSHVVAIGIVLVFLFVVVNLMTGSRATAKDPAQFPEQSEEDWKVEKAANDARWALEKPAEEGESDEDE